MTGYQLAVGVHLGAGSVALIGFWTAAWLRKGTDKHRWVGRVYLVAMLLVILSGVPLTLGAIERGHPVSAMFLGFLLLLVSQGCWSAWRAIVDRRDPQRCFGPVHQVLSLLCLLGGLGMIGIGVQVSAVLLMVFGSVGVLVGWGGLRARGKSIGDPRWWLKTHYGAMIGNGVATHIAFLAIGINRLIPGIDPGLQQSVAWFGPLLVSVVAAFWLNRKYGRPAVPVAARGGEVGHRGQAQV